MEVTFISLIFGLLSFTASKKNTLTMLISLEMMMISTMMIIILNSKDSNTTQVLFILMAFMVSESATAMSLVTKYSKNKGSQLISL